MIFHIFNSSNLCSLSKKMNKVAVIIVANELFYKLIIMKKMKITQNETKYDKQIVIKT